MVKIMISELPGLKKKVLLIYDSEKNMATKVASFNNDEMAILFAETFSTVLEHVYQKGLQDSKKVQNQDTSLLS